MLDQLQQRTSQLATLQKEYEAIVVEVKSAKETARKLSYENEKLFAECQANKKN